ncbi:C4-dicarboxylate ABC transporter [Aquicoccus sp. SCR17]|nr:C4-dicarboxylate ABC transporter [Carideicomes alvinocaridis]
MIRRHFLNVAGAGLLAVAATGITGLTGGAAAAQEITLRLHQFLPPMATVPKHILKPWAAAVEEAANGKVKIEHYDAMALGGRPTELMDQAQDGVVDMSMTLVGYTPGRFPRTEVFELPFMMKDPIGTALAFQQMVDEDFASNEYAGLKVLGAWVHGPGLIHSRVPVESLDDMEGLKVRAPTRVINDYMNELGATAVGMPLPAIPEALSKGVVDATVLPWEVTPSIKLAELVENHTEFSGEAALYTSTVVLVMNRDRYESLPEDVRAAIDGQSGEKLSRLAAEQMWKYDKPGRDIAEERGNNIITLDEAETARFREAAQPVYDRWVADMEERGIDGQALIDRARALIDEKSAE